MVDLPYLPQVSQRIGKSTNEKQYVKNISQLAAQTLMSVHMYHAMRQFTHGRTCSSECLRYLSLSQTFLKQE